MNYLVAVQALAEQKTNLDAALSEWMASQPADDPTSMALMTVALAMSTSLAVQVDVLAVLGAASE